MAKNIVSIGFQLAHEGVTPKPFASNTSLLDWDIVLFRPDATSYLGDYGEETYNGKRCLNDAQSFSLKAGCEHWRREIKEAVHGGKTVIVFLSEVEDLYVATGEMQYSGTGRNRHSTRMVELYSNYKSLPISQKIVSTHGTSMKLSQSHSSILASYWLEFEKDSSYRLIFPDAKTSCIQTRTGEKAVGLIFNNSKSDGSLVLLPDIDFDKADFFTPNRQKFTKKAFEFAARLISQVVILDKSLRSASEATPEPTWVSDPGFTTRKEASLRQKLLLAEAVVEEAQKGKEAIEDEIRESGRIKGLLYESGKNLEGSIVEALKILGFTASSFQNAESEFDVVFESEEGRLIGEAEGKENKAVNIEKLRQLSMNIHEDLQREDVDAPAKGILFGNGYRQTDPVKHAGQFTSKCISAAQSTCIGLVATSDLYLVVKYLLDTPDGDFAKLCRQAIATAEGAVSFPVIPSAQPGPENDTDVANAS